MRPAQFIEMIARLSASGDKTDPDGDPCPNGFEHDTGNSLDALDEAIHKARDIAKWFDAPERNFVEAGWSFRFGIEAATGTRSFSVIPKGARFMHYHGDRADLTRCSDGRTWRYTVMRDGFGKRDARASFAEAKKHVLTLLAASAPHEEAR